MRVDLSSRKDYCFNELVYKFKQTERTNARGWTGDGHAACRCLEGLGVQWLSFG